MLPLIAVITAPVGMPVRIASVPAAGAIKLVSRVMVLPLIAVILAPVGTPLSTVRVPEEAAVRVVLRVMTFVPALIAVMVVPAGIPTPVTICPTTRLFTSARVMVFAFRLPRVTALVDEAEKTVWPIARSAVFATSKVG